MGVQRKDRKCEVLSGWKKFIVASQVAAMIMLYGEKRRSGENKGKLSVFCRYLSMNERFIFMKSY